jgi:hypothetical protein
VLLLLPVAMAHSCDDPHFRTLSAPTPGSNGHGVRSGEGTLNGAAAVGVRFTYDSKASAAAWTKVLRAAETQDDWVPERFGYDFVERVDARHLYLRFDVGLLWGKVHIRRQLVVRTAEDQTQDRYRTCWVRVDQTPFTAQIARWADPDVAWEEPSAGWWEVTTTADGARIGYQWWSASTSLSPSIQAYGVKNTLPDLLAAFDARAQQVGG